MRMSLQDVYAVLALLVKGQEAGVRLLEFSAAYILNFDADPDPEISELIDPLAQSPELPTSLRDGTSNAITNAPSPPLPQSSPPLSQSTIKVAIENVAEAGYLRIISDRTTVDAPNQVLNHSKTASQQGGKGKTSASNSKKRRREETGEGGPNEDRQTKKHDGRISIPQREQSSRYVRLGNFIEFIDISFIASRMPIIKTSMSQSAPARSIKTQ